MKLHWVVLLCFGSLMSCAQNNRTEVMTQDSKKKIENYIQNGIKLKVATFAGGCFWCTEAIFEDIIGVREVISGYSGGTKVDPTYEEVCTGRTGHAEAFQVYYDPAFVSFEDLVRVFFASIDPFVINRQGPDRGTQYRTIAFYNNDEEKSIIEAKIREIGKDSDEPVATQVVKFEKFYQAEDYHQDYVKRNPYQPYVRGVSIPRRTQTLKKVEDLVKKE